MLYGLSGMWLFSLILVLPLLVGVASTSKRLYQFLLDRGISKNNAMTASVVALVMLAGVMSSPLFLGALPMRVLAGASYLYFLFIGTKQIIGFFSPPGDENRSDSRRSPVASPAKPEPAPREPDESCGCDHGDVGSKDDTAGGAEHAPGSADGAADGVDGSNDGLEQDRPSRKTPPPQRTPRTPAEARAEIERRISEREKNGGDEKK